MCDKVPYQTREAARNAAQGIGKSGRGAMKEYYCRLCEAWHIASSGGRSKIRSQYSKKYPFKMPLKKKNK